MALSSRKRRFLAVLVLGIVISVLVWVMQALDLGDLFTDLLDDPILTVVAVLALFGALLGVFQAVRRHRHQGHLVLWCRRFGHWDDIEGKRNEWLLEIVSRACAGFALPVTLSDRSVSAARSISKYLEVSLTLLLMLAVFVGMLGLLSVDLGSQSKWVPIVLSVLGMMLMVVVVNWLLTSFGTYRGEPDQMRAHVRNVAERGYHYGDSLVIRCTDGDWQACVEVLLQESSLVILDLTDATRHILWEIRRSLELLGPNRILFVQEVDRPGEPCLLTDEPPEGAESLASGPCTYLRYDRAQAQTERDAQRRRSQEGRESSISGPLAQKLEVMIGDWMKGAVHKNEG